MMDGFPFGAEDFLIGIILGVAGIFDIVAVNFAMLIPAAIVSLYFKKVWLSSAVIIMEGLIFAVWVLFFPYKPYTPPFVIGFSIGLSIYGPIVYFLAKMFWRIYELKEYESEDQTNEEEIEKVTKD